MAAVKSGWTDLGGNQVRNSATGEIVDQNHLSYTQYQNPYGAPVSNTANQAMQHKLASSWYQQAGQDTKIDRNDPNYRQQADAFASGQDQSRRQYQSEAAERLSASGAGAMTGELRQEQRLANEKASFNQGQFEAALVGRELDNRRDEIKTGLEGMRGLIANDQQLGLQRELAQLEAAIKREGLAQSGDLGNKDLAMRDKLGTGSLNVDLMRALLQNQQSDKNLGLQYDQAEYGRYLDSIFGR